MNYSKLIINNTEQLIKNIKYDKGLLEIETKDYDLNIDINYDISNLISDKRVNISDKIYGDLHLNSKEYSYLINPENNIYITKINDHYLIEILLPNVKYVIPPFDKINKKRLEKGNNAEIKSLDLKIHFKI